MECRVNITKTVITDDGHVLRIGDIITCKIHCWDCERDIAGKIVEIEQSNMRLDILPEKKSILPDRLMIHYDQIVKGSVRFA